MATSVLYRASIPLLASTVLLQGCGDSGNKKTTPSNKPSINTSASPPNYSIKQLESARLSAAEIGYGVKQHPVALISLRNGEIPVCSLAGVKLPGDPVVDMRQFSKPTADFSGANHARVVARYEDSASATKSYNSIKKRLSNCPKEQSIPQKRINNDFVQFSHKDTWRSNEDLLKNWAHIRGYEKQITPPSATKLNITYLFYDYLMRGNVILITLYWERVSPSAPDEAIAKRATTILEKQLTKIN